MICHNLYEYEKLLKPADMRKFLFCSKLGQLLWVAPQLRRWGNKYSPAWHIGFATYVLD
jgi:hypothetical protein